MKRYRRTLPVLLCLALPLLLAGCARPSLVHGTEHPALERQAPIHTVAVVPFTMSDKLLLQADAAESPELMAHHVSEALTARGLTVIAPSDVGRALQASAISVEKPALAPMAQLLSREFGAEAFVTGRVHRWREREGNAAAAGQPASVGYELTLRAAPGGQKLWSGIFDETQKPLGENVLVTTQYPGGGTRWLTAEELARWGAEQVVGQAPLPGTPSP